MLAKRCCLLALLLLVSASEARRTQFNAASLLDINADNPRSSSHLLPERLAQKSNLRGVQKWQWELKSAMNKASIRQYHIDWAQLGLEDDNTGDFSDSDDAQRMMDCINDVYEPGNMTWSAAMRDQSLGDFRAIGAWWTSEDHATDEPLPMTVSTTASVSRLPQLYAQCLSWSGALSVALYQPLLQQHPGPLTPDNQAALRLAVSKAAQFVSDMLSTSEACRPDVLLVYEMFTDDTARRLLYPFNTLRNLARLQARTPLVALVDVDLLISRSVYERAANPTLMSELMHQVQHEKSVFIIPAFDARGKSERAAWAQALVSASKDMMVFAYQKGIVFQFALDRGYYQGHNLTNYAKWLDAVEDYETQFETLCEPWIIGDRLQLPWNDARYRGYGFDKVQFIEDVNANGFKFKVMHDTFVIHRAHQKNAARTRFLKYKKDVGDEPSLFTHNLGLWTQQVNQHQLGLPFYPALHPSTDRCLSQLPWWKNTRGPANVAEFRREV